MAIVAIGAIGTANYTEVKYKFSETSSVTTCYSLDALIRREDIKFDKTIVLLTSGARRDSWDIMKLYLEQYSRAGQICDVTIDDGRNEAELWAIFEAIVENVADGDELYIDITNGLRHLPVLLLIACSYLRVARNVTIKSLSYGAFDLGVREGRVVKECDVLELLPYVALFDWSSAVQAFQRSGDARVLAELLSSSLKGSSFSSDVSGAAKKVAAKLDNISLALELARPEEASLVIKELERELQAGSASFKQYAKPFALLSELISTTFKKIGLPQPRAGVTSVENKLDTQRKLIEWYEDKKQLALSVLLAREWLVSRHMVEKGQAARIEYYEDRKQAGGELSKNLNTSLEIFDIWEKLRQVRNDIAHMGQSSTRLKAEELRREIKNSLKNLRAIR